MDEPKVVKTTHEIRCVTNGVEDTANPHYKGIREDDDPEKWARTADSASCPGNEPHRIVKIVTTEHTVPRSS